jgi:zinc/manganese transport system ATP-binding protein
VIELAARLCREMKITVLFSAHELNQLLGAIDRVLYLGSGQAALGTVDDVITEPVLSRLYGAPIEVVRSGRHIFVLSESAPVAGDGHRHEHDHDHGHSHEHP